MPTSERYGREKLSRRRSFNIVSSAKKKKREEKKGSVRKVCSKQATLSGNPRLPPKRQGRK